jgi:hypothetical protein
LQILLQQQKTREDSAPPKKGAQPEPEAIEYGISSHHPVQASTYTVLAVNASMIQASLKPNNSEEARPTYSNAEAIKAGRNQHTNFHTPAMSLPKLKECMFIDYI